MKTLSAGVICVTAALLFACGQPDAASPEPGNVLERFPMTASTLQQWKLPGKLNEISGLALSDDGRLFATADEEAIIYELDYHQGRLIKAFALGKPTVRADFEGIAIIDGRFFLTTSDGDIYSAPEGADGERVSYRKYVTEIGEHCEIEGLAALHDKLLLLCKKVRSNDLIDALSIFAWASRTGKLLPADLIELPESEILGQLEMDRISPSGLAVDSATGHLLIVAAHQQALIETTIDGNLIQAQEMPLAGRHQQAEGIEITRTGRLLISDEGGSRKARIAVYRMAEEGEEQNQ